MHHEVINYIWRSKYAEMTVPDARRLRDLESENNRLNKLLAESHLDIEVLKVVARGKSMHGGTPGGCFSQALIHRHFQAPGLHPDRTIPIRAAL